MKNIQFIDNADNCTFSIFQATEEEFEAIFPDEGQDIEFSEDVYERLGDDRAFLILSLIWERPIEKNNAVGIDGSLFYGFAKRRKHFPTSKRERDWNASSINPAQRRLYGQER